MFWRSVYTLKYIELKLKIYFVLFVKSISHLFNHLQIPSMDTNSNQTHCVVWKRDKHLLLWIAKISTDYLRVWGGKYKKSKGAAEGEPCSKYIWNGTSVYVVNPFLVFRLIPNRTYTKPTILIRSNVKMISPFSWKKQNNSYWYYTRINGVVK